MDFEHTVSFSTPKQRTVQKVRITPKEFVVALPQNEQADAVKAFKVLKDSEDRTEKTNARSFLKEKGFIF